MHQLPTPHAGAVLPASGVHDPGVLAELAYAGGTASIRDARDRVAELVAPHVRAGDVDSVRLLTSELVANGFRHGSGTVRVTVGHDHDRVWVSVSDGGGGRVRMRVPGVEGPGGYGMHLVEAFAAGWEHTADGVGTTVRFWFDAAG